MSDLEGDILPPRQNRDSLNKTHFAERREIRRAGSHGSTAGEMPRRYVAGVKSRPWQKAVFNETVKPVESEDEADDEHG